MESNQNRKYCVYKHTLRNDGRCYIGITCQQPPSHRWGTNGIKYKDSPKFYNAIQKYGWDNFDHEILEDHLTLEEANQKEYEYIKQYDSHEHGFNIELGGGAHTRSKETRKKIGKGHKGKPLSPEHIAKLKVAQLGEKNPNYGKPRSEETKKKIGAANRILQQGRKASEKTRFKMSLAHRKYDKPFLCIETNKIYGCPTEARLDLNIKEVGHITEVCQGKRQTAYGYHWRYLTEEEKEEYWGYGSI